MTRDRSPFRYLPWLARTVAVGPLALFAVAAVMVAIVLWRFHLAQPGAPVPSAGGIQGATWSVVLTVAVLIATGGVMGTDVQRGYYRSLFSKPMAPEWYYAQRFLVGAAAVLVTPLIYGVALRLLLHTTDFGWSGALFAGIGLALLLTGGATLLFSTITSRDWLVVFLLVFLQGRLAALVEMSQRFNAPVPAWVVWIWRVLPPFHLIRTTAPGLHGSELVHVVAYGAGMMLAALLIMRYRPLGSGGRA